MLVLGADSFALQTAVTAAWARWLFLCTSDPSAVRGTKARKGHHGLAASQLLLSSFRVAGPAKVDEEK